MKLAIVGLMASSAALGDEQEALAMASDLCPGGAMVLRSRLFLPQELMWQRSRMARRPFTLRSKGMSVHRGRSGRGGSRCAHATRPYYIHDADNVGCTAIVRQVCAHAACRLVAIERPKV